MINNILLFHNAYSLTITALVAKSVFRKFSYYLVTYGYTNFAVRYYQYILSYVNSS